ncbi:MAG: flavin reductase [Lentisphaeria bacterium]|nr:flavin reductase [Lentisphaeria bacterium]
MRKNFGAQTWLYPMPVLIIGTYDENGTPNAMNAAWGGIHDHDQIAVCIDPPHKTAANLQKNGFFTVSIGTAETVVECDYVGIVSGNNAPDKVVKADLRPRKGEFADAPVFEALPLTLECRLISFDKKTGCTVGEILNISADESILDADGKVTLDKFHPLIYDPVTHEYRTIGSKAGDAFCDGKKLKA